MSEDGDDSGQAQADSQDDDRRILAEKIIEGQLGIAILAMTEVVDHIASADLPWTDVKTIILGNRAESILSDLDHMVVRVREQPVTDQKIRSTDDYPPEAS